MDPHLQSNCEKHNGENISRPLEMRVLQIAIAQLFFLVPPAWTLKIARDIFYLSAFDVIFSFKLSKLIHLPSDYV